MKQIGEPKRVTAPNALGHDSTCIHTMFEIDDLDVGRVKENYLGFRHRSVRLTRDMVGRRITVYTDGSGWNCWTLDSEGEGHATTS